MSEYLSRPIFDIPVNWVTNPSCELSNDLRVLQIGKGAPKYQRLQSFTGAVFEFEVLLRNESEIISFESFITACQGRLNGFWIKHPTAAASILGADGATAIEVAKGFDLDASEYLVFCKAGESPQYTHAVSVDDSGNNTDIITLDGSGASVDASWDVYRLLYVRFASDEFTLEYHAGNIARAVLRVVELTNEYAQTETGQRPIYLYEFTLPLATPVYYRFTSFDASITSNGSVFASGSYEHDGHKQSLTNGDSETKIASVYESGNPLIKFFPFNLPAPLNITIYESTATAPNTRATVFSGRVMSVNLDGMKIVATCKTVLAVVGRKFPRFNVQQGCNYFLFDANCRVSKSDHKYTATVYRAGINNLELEMVKDHTGTGIDELALDDDYFSFGWLEFGSGASMQIRTIVKATTIPVDIETGTGRIMLSLDLPLTGAAEGNTVTLYPGCNGSRQACKEKFNNWLNFGGHVMAPGNLSIIAVEQTNTNGNKK